MKNFVELLRKYVEISHHYEAGEKTYVHFRCNDSSGHTDEVMLRYISEVATASNNFIMIQPDEPKGFYFTLVVQHNLDIIEHYLSGK